MSRFQCIMASDPDYDYKTNAGTQWMLYIYFKIIMITVMFDDDPLISSHAKKIPYLIANAEESPFVFKILISYCF